jgi:pyruvate decarboxylase
LDDPEFGHAGCFEMVELILAPLDAPKAVITTGEAIDEFNKSKAEKAKGGVPGA